MTAHGMTFCDCQRCAACDWSEADDSFAAGCAREVERDGQCCEPCAGAAK